MKRFITYINEFKLKNDSNVEYHDVHTSIEDKFNNYCFITSFNEGEPYSSMGNDTIIELKKYFPKKIIGYLSNPKHDILQKGYEYFENILNNINKQSKIKPIFSVYDNPTDTKIDIYRYNNQYIGHMMTSYKNKFTLSEEEFIFFVDTNYKIIK